MQTDTHTHKHIHTEPCFSVLPSSPFPPICRTGRALGEQKERGFGELGARRTSHTFWSVWGSPVELSQSGSAGECVGASDPRFFAHGREKVETGQLPLQAWQDLQHFMLLLHGFTHHLGRESERGSGNPPAVSQNLLNEMPLWPLPCEFLYSLVQRAFPTLAKLVMHSYRRKRKLSIFIPNHLPTLHSLQASLWKDQLFPTTVDKKDPFWLFPRLSYCFLIKPPIPTVHRPAHLPPHHVSQWF